MSDYLEYEKRLEIACLDAFKNRSIDATRARGIDHLAVNNVQLVVQYNGTMDDGRQTISNHQEYDLHDASLEIVVNTYRANIDEHSSRLGQVRAAMLNSAHPFQTAPYKVFDIRPEGTTTLEDEENNIDQSTLTFRIYFQTNLTKLEIE
jgi:hypothetical protein